MKNKTNILFITTEWPTDSRPYEAPFLRDYAHAIQDAGFHVDVFHFKGKANPINYLKAWINIRKSHFWDKADILHAHWGQSALLAFPSKKPLFVTFHGSDLHGIVNQKGKYGLIGTVLVALSKWISKKADQIIVVSEQMKRLLPVTTQSTIEVIPMGIDLSVFKPLDQDICRDRLGMDPNIIYVLFTSDPKRLEKRYKLALQATNLVNTDASSRKVELLVVNDQPHDKISEYLNACDVLLLTSSHEGSPVIIKEALACNMPIVSVDVGDVRERIAGINGCYLCPDDRAETIADYLQLSIASTERTNGFTSVRKFDWQAIAQATITLYRKYLV